MRTVETFCCVICCSYTPIVILYINDNGVRLTYSTGLFARLHTLELSLYASEETKDRWLGGANRRGR
jgi:hypothetical protein